MQVSPADLPLPAALDPILDYLSDHLPGPIYSFLLSSLSHLLAVCTALYSVVLSLLSTHPVQWDAQTVLPPLIALFTSYLAILSLYRTTTWMLRTSIFFVKWGTIFGALIAGTSWMLMQGGGNAVGGNGLAATLSGLLLDSFSGDTTTKRKRSRSQTRKARPKAQRPQPWESWDTHRDWREQNADNDDAGDVLASVLDAAGSAVKGKWWELAKGFLKADDSNEESIKQSKGRSGKTKTRSA